MKSVNKISNKIKIGNFIISKNNSCFIVAELSRNHGGKKKNVFTAIDLITKNLARTRLNYQSMSQTPLLF